MANTTIQLKKSSTPSSTPSSLANGELAINFADGKLFYKNAAGYIVEFNPSTSSYYFGTVNANSTLLVADTTSDVLTMVPGNNITIVGDAVNDKVTVGLSNDVTIPGKLNVGSDFTHTGGSFYINNASGAGGTDEGGEIKLANATTNQILSGPISIDIFQNKLRFFETNSPNRGAFINLASAAAGVGTDLLSTGNSAVDSVARASASAAFDKANNALANTDGITFGGTLNVSKNLVADRVSTLNNGNGENFKVGDDAWIGDTNVADTVRIKGQQNASNGYILFGSNDGVLLGRNGSNALTYGGNTVWHAGTDGAGSGLDADLLDGQHGSYYTTIASSAYDKANAANVLAFSALANTDNILFGGTLNVSKNLTADKIISSNNNNGENFKIGDDAWIGDVNIPNTFRIKGIADPQQAYIIFNTVDTKALGRSGSGALTWDGNTIWHSGNDGAGFGLDADLLDGQHGNFYATAANVVSAFDRANSSNIIASNAYDKANAANLLAYNTGIGANAFTSATIAGANSAVGGGANAFSSVTISGANTAVGAGANAFAAATIAGANTAVGNGANNYANTTFVKLLAGNQTITGNLSISGSLVVSGNAYRIDANTLSVQDPLIYLAGNNYVSDLVDIGFVANYVSGNGQNLHTGLFRDATVKEYYLFQGYNQEPIFNDINPSANGFTLSVLNADIRTSNLNLAGANAVTWITAAFAKANSSTATVINADNISATRYIVFANNTTGNLVTANVTTGLTFNPSANNLSVANTVFATHFDNTSDRNLKENIVSIIDASVILNLNPVSFNWKATGEKSYGLIAQEVEPIIPEVVHTNDNGIKTIEYVQLISLLIAKIQEQQQQIDDINRRLNNMPSNP